MRQLIGSRLSGKLTRSTLIVFALALELTWIFTLGLGAVKLYDWAT
jgi:hypothetical protein